MGTPGRADDPPTKDMSRQSDPCPKGYKIAAFYCCLSRDDKLQDDSNGVVNQKVILSKYAKENGIARKLRRFSKTFLCCFIECRTLGFFSLVL